MQIHWQIFKFVVHKNQKQIWKNVLKKFSIFKKKIYNFSILSFFKKRADLMLYCDNNGALKISKEPRSHKMGKHIKRKYHLIREVMYRGDANVIKIASKDNLADPFTKTLPESVLNKHLLGIGLRHMTHLI